MIWKVIGQSVIGTSHIQSGKGCEDAVLYQLVDLADEEQALICLISDGAGSAQFAAEASQLTVQKGVSILADWIAIEKIIDEAAMTELAELLYDQLKVTAEERDVPLNEFSCTLLGFVILPDQACFLQIGDGAIVRDDGNGNFMHLWWPHNGEYQNTTAFLIDDPNLSQLKMKVVYETVTEVAIFSDGLQMLALNNETESVHQPFFADLFKVLRMTNSPEHIDILNNRLSAYLSGEAINNRTDDDKTLLIATRLNDGRIGL
ncbi:MAG: PP2C family serine/threonine-protein phosphatase [Mucilaginibacter sp.]|uniref:PP2C family serine/threonine-protein phosphatase n=1 Tax=Mucilaginibacter sp. TaxID=1882438 RepID=UPI0032662E88